MNDDEALNCAVVDEWRGWLAANGSAVRSVWLIVHRGPDGLNLPTAVEDALCFGWIDSKTVRRGERATYQNFTPPKPRSTRSKGKPARGGPVTAAGPVMAPGQALVDHAHPDGTPGPPADA